MMNLEKAISKIKEVDPKTILVQLPDGFKPKVPEIDEELKKHTSAQIFFWLGSCYGACDYPSVDVDLLIQLGHSEWR